MKTAKIIPISRAVAKTRINRGYVMLYHRGQVNHCPSCSKKHWLVGRASAECFHCGMALAMTAPVCMEDVKG